MIPRLFVYVPELKKYLPAQAPGSAWDIQFWRAIYKAEGRCTALIHMGSMPRYRISVRAA
jgi:hypothetical protein